MSDFWQHGPHPETGVVSSGTGAAVLTASCARQLDSTRVRQPVVGCEPDTDDEIPVRR